MRGPVAMTQQSEIVRIKLLMTVALKEKLNGHTNPSDVYFPVCGYLKKKKPTCASSTNQIAHLKECLNQNVLVKPQ